MIKGLMLEFPQQQQRQDHTHTHTRTHRLDEQWYWYGSGFPPCSRINHLKGNLLSGPFLLFLTLLPPLPHTGPFGPKYSNSETTSGKKKRCLRALWRRTEPEERRFNCGRTFPQTTAWLFSRVLRPGGFLCVEIQTMHASS